jgi:hypothetical protein
MVRIVCKGIGADDGESIHMMKMLQEPTSRSVGAAPMFRQMADEIELIKLIHEMVQWDMYQTAVSPGNSILVLDMLAGKAPMANSGLEADRNTLKKRCPAQYADIPSDAQDSPCAPGIRIP